MPAPSSAYLCQACAVRQATGEEHSKQSSCQQHRRGQQAAGCARLGLDLEAHRRHMQAASLLRLAAWKAFGLTTCQPAAGGREQGDVRPKGHMQRQR